MLQCENNTLHIDGTKKRFREFNTVNITTGNGESMSLGFDEMSGGTTEDYLTSTIGIMREIADLLLPEDATKFQKDEKLAELLTSVRNTMTDRHIVNKKFDESLEEIRENYIGLTKQDMEDLTQEEIKDLVHMNNLFCSVHVVGNCGSVAKTSLKLFEEICELQNANKTGTAQTYQFLYALSKALTFGHNYQKAGVADYWAVFMDEMKLRSQIMSLKGERFNVLFLLGVAAYYHREHIVQFIAEKITQNQLTAALKDIDNPIVQSACRALGIMGQLVTDPLFRVISDAKSVLELNELWDDVRNDVAQYAENPKPLMEGRGPESLKHVVKKESPVHNCLFDDRGDVIDSLTALCLRMLAVAIEKLILKQLEDQLPGGKFHKPSPQILKETSKVPATNLITERDFAQLGGQLKEKPTLSTVSLNGTVTFRNNHTLKWLQSLTKERLSDIMGIARRRAPEIIRAYKEKKARVKKALSEKMKKRHDLKEKKIQKKTDTAEKLINKVAKVGGLMESVSDLNTALSKATDEEQYEILADQIRLRKALSVTKGDYKKYHLSTHGHRLSNSILKSNLIDIMGQSVETVEEDTCAIINISEIEKKIDDNVKAKRKELHEHKEPAAQKKKKKLTPLIGQKVHHRYKMEDGTARWYEGDVLNALDDENHPDCRYRIQYEGENEPIELPLREDHKDHTLIIQDII